MTNILLLPQLSGSITAVTNADFRAAIQFILTSGGSDPLDITGITFRQRWSSLSSPITTLDLSTDNGRLVNGGANGTLYWVVPGDALSKLMAGSYAADLLAVADGYIINLFQSGPLSVVLNAGITP